MSSFDSKPANGGRPVLLTRDWICLWGFVAIFALLQVALAYQASSHRLISRGPVGYYHYETEALLSGQLALKIAPRPELLALSNPYNSALNQPYREIDLSLYRGRYYFYWGLTPVVLLFGPWFLAIGTFPSEALACALFSLGAQMCMGWLILICRRTYFPKAGGFLTGLALLCAGAACYLPVGAGANSVYGVPIASAAFCQAFVWCCVFRAMHAPKSAVGWTLLAGLGLGLCLASRPNYILWAACFLLPLGALLLRRPQERFRLVMAASLPPLICVAGMLAMNWLRFGKITEFGMRYQLTGPGQPETLFSWSNVTANWSVYAWNLPRFIKLFPFVTTLASGPFGMLSTLPAVYLVFGLCAVRVSRMPTSLVWAIAAAGFGGLIGTCAFFGCGGRYMVDYLPASLLAGSIGALAAADASSQSGRKAPQFALGLALALSLTASVLLQMQSWGSTGDRLRPFARVFNAPIYAWDHLTGREEGPLIMRFKLPQKKDGQFEPLASLGSASEGGEIVFMNYVDSSHVRLGFFHTGTTHWLSQPIELEFARIHELFVGLGSLLPPDSAPVFSHWSDEARRSAQQDVTLKLDGRIVYQSHLDFGLRHGVDLVNIGKAAAAGVCGPVFTGRSLETRRIPIPLTGPGGAIEPGAAMGTPDLSKDNGENTRYGGWRLRLMFPKNPPKGRYDPILVSGVPGAADFVYVFYPGPGKVAFAHDSWSLGGSASASVSIDLSHEHVVEVRHGGLYPAESHALVSGTRTPAADRMKNHLQILLDGAVVMDIGEHFYDAAPETVTPAENRIGGSSTAAVFSGKVISAERLRN